jgi:hypothetical protein
MLFPFSGWSTFGVIVSMPFLYAVVHLIVEKFYHKTPQNSAVYIEYSHKCIPTLWFLPVALLNQITASDPWSILYIYNP